MYEELVKRLRARAKREDEYWEYGGDVINEADDAIEEMSHEYESIEKSLTKSVELVRKLQSQRWIPVTEQLPENGADVLVYIERDAWGEDLPYRKRDIAVGYHVNGWWKVDGYSGVFCIVWKQLPKPPKEEVEA